MEAAGTAVPVEVMEAAEAGMAVVAEVMPEEGMVEGELFDFGLYDYSFANGCLKCRY